jgi:TatA/E family protein of Tat protein translocase
MPNIGAPELIVILVIALLIIGPGKLPDVGSALGKSIREFRKASSDVQEAAKIDTSPMPPPNSSSTTPEPNVLHTPTPPAPSTPPPSDSTSEQNH